MSYSKSPLKRLISMPFFIRTTTIMVKCECLLQCNIIAFIKNQMATCEVIIIDEKYPIIQLFALLITVLLTLIDDVLKIPVHGPTHEVECYTEYCHLFLICYYVCSAKKE